MEQIRRRRPRLHAFLLSSTLAATSMSPTTAQAAGASDCPAGASGPLAGSSEPYQGGMCDLGTLRADGLGSGYAYGISADGRFIVGYARTPDYQFRAIRWSHDAGGMIDLGSLRADNLGSSVAYGLSDDGRTVIGQSQTEDGSARAFRWVDDGSGMLDLGSLRTDNTGYSYAEAVSGDGGTIIGEAMTDDGIARAFRWIDDGNGMLDLGTLRAGNAGYSSAKRVSADGSVIVGGSDTDDGTDRAFRWVDDGSGMRDLGSLRSGNAGYSYVQAISADGSTIIGGSDSDYSYNRAFRWIDDGNGMLDLGSLRTDNTGYADATAISANGSVIAGQATTDDDRTRAFRWIDDGNGMIDLGSLRTDAAGSSSSRAISADGSTIVGESESNDGSTRAFRWTDAGGMIDLGSLRADNSGSSSASDVSADGSVVIGTAETDDGDNRAFIWLSRMQDLANLNASFATLAARSDAAIARQQDLAAGMLRQNTSLDAGRSWLRISGDLAATGKAGEHGLARHTGATANLAYGYGIDGNVTIGTAIAFGGTGFSGFETGAHLGAGLWATYSETGADAAGWQADFGAAFSHGKAEITRGTDLRNVMAASGDATLRGLAVQASLGYGFAPVAGWRLTPKAGLSHFRSRRAAYEEIGADFNASYEALSVSRTSVTLSLDAETRISERGTLSLGAGIDHDLAADRARLKGRSTIPGLESFALSSNLEHRDSRAFGTIGYGHDLGQGAKISAALRLGQSRYGDRIDSHASIGYELRF